MFSRIASFSLSSCFKIVLNLEADHSFTFAKNGEGGDGGFSSLRFAVISWDRELQELLDVGLFITQENANHN